MKTKILLLFYCFSINCVYSQSSEGVKKVMFYNVENLFHPSKDSVKSDGDFTPTGLYHWTYKKYYRKVSMTGKVIIAAGEGEPPWIVGLAEIENEQVVKDLCYRTPLKRYNYGYVHYESPDRRGVDVALLYRKDSVNILNHRKIPVVFPFEPSTKNRDILQVTVELVEGDTLDIFVNHWTSRYGGYAATVPKRNHYASTLRNVIDSIIGKNEKAKILVMGDFNDYADNESLREILGAEEYNGYENGMLYNLVLGIRGKKVSGTHKHEDFWGCLDQIIVTKGLIFSEKGVVISGGAVIFEEDFLLEADEKYGGWKNNRTYSGPRYIGGFSDHLPIYIRLEERKKVEN